MKYWQGRELFTVGCDEAVTERNRDNLVEEKMLSGELWMDCPTNNEWMVDAPLGTGQCYSQVMVACRGRIFWHSAEQKVVGTFRNERREMDDLISRQAAIDALWKALFSYEEKEEERFQKSEELNVGDWFHHRIFVQNMNDIDRQAIRELPSAQPERKRGAWVGVGFYDEDCRHHLWYACDKCSYQTTWHMKPIFNFCPNCGAYMRGEQQ